MKMLRLLMVGVLLGSILVSLGCSSSEPTSETPGKKAAPTTTDHSKSK